MKTFYSVAMIAATFWAGSAQAQAVQTLRALKNCTPFAGLQAIQTIDTKEFQANNLFNLTITPELNELRGLSPNDANRKARCEALKPKAQRWFDLVTELVPLLSNAIPMVRTLEGDGKTDGQGACSSELQDDRRLLPSGYSNLQAKFNATCAGGGDAPQQPQPGGAGGR